VWSQRGSRRDDIVEGRLSIQDIESMRHHSQPAGAYFQILPDRSKVAFTRLSADWLSFWGSDGYSVYQHGPGLCQSLASSINKAEAWSSCANGMASRSPDLIEETAALAAAAEAAAPQTRPEVRRPTDARMLVCVAAAVR
jgi:hypothetical protein